MPRLPSLVSPGRTKSNSTFGLVELPASSEFETGTTAPSTLRRSSERGVAGEVVRAAEQAKPRRSESEQEEDFCVSTELSWESLSMPLLLKRNKLLERENRLMRKELGLPKHQGEEPGESPFRARRRAKLLEARVNELEAERGALLARALVAEEQLDSLQAQMFGLMEGYEKRLAQAFDGQVAGMSRDARTHIILRRGKDEAAKRIQALHRGNQARRANKTTLMENAVTRIQAAFRGNTSREQVAVMRAAKSWRAAQKRGSLKKEEAEKQAAEAKRASLAEENESDSESTSSEDL